MLEKYCTHCGKQILKRYNIFCDKSCSAKYCNSRRERKKKKFSEKECQFCGKLFSHKSNKCCSRKCSARLGNSTRKPMSAEQKLKISRTIEKLYFDNPEKFSGPKTINYGRRKPPNINICRICKKEFSTYSRYRINCSDACLRIDRGIRAGNLKRVGNWGKQGHYQQIHCDSTYELAFLLWALRENKNIFRCKLRIPYFYNNSIHHYTPDFQIDDQIIEIKGYVDERALLKLEAAKQIGLKINMITQKEIKFYTEYVRKHYGNCPIREYYKFYSQK